MAKPVSHGRLIDLVLASAMSATDRVMGPESTAFKKGVGVPATHVGCINVIRRRITKRWNNPQYCRIGYPLVRLTAFRYTHVTEMGSLSRLTHDQGLEMSRR